jgi:hypothetical protein
LPSAASNENAGTVLKGSQRFCSEKIQKWLWKLLKALGDKFGEFFGIRNMQTQK